LRDVPNDSAGRPLRPAGPAAIQDDPAGPARTLRDVSEDCAGRPVRLLTLLLAIVGFGVGGCAKREPPSGGPPDVTPPRLVRSDPDSGRASVPLETRVALTFSEAMEPRSTSEAVQ